MADEKKTEKAAKPSGSKKGGGKKRGGPTYKVAGAGETKVSPATTPRILKLYREKIVPALQSEFKFDSAMMVPRVKKVVVNCCMKESVANPKVLDSVLSDLAVITGQKPVLTRARKSEAAFKLRAGLPIGARVTLRHARMWEFLERLIHIALPRVRDFKGISPKSFDGRGNYSLGLKEHIIFPEINYDQVDSIFGFTVTVETTARNNQEGRALLGQLGMPFKN